MASKTELQNGIIDGLSDTFDSALASYFKMRVAIERESVRLKIPPQELIKNIVDQYMSNDYLICGTMEREDIEEETEENVTVTEHARSILGVASLFIKDFSESQEEFQKNIDDVVEVIDEYMCEHFEQTDHVCTCEDCQKDMERPN